MERQIDPELGYDDALVADDAEGPKKGSGKKERGGGGGATGKQRKKMEEKSRGKSNSKRRLNSASRMWVRKGRFGEKTATKRIGGG